MAKRLPGILPGEQNKGKPGKKPGKGRIPHGTPGSIPGSGPKPRYPGEPPRGGPISNDPAPTSYGDLKKAFRTKGQQPGEKAAVGRIAANRGVSRAEAREIAVRRTSKGMSIKGSVGPNAKPPMPNRPDGPVIKPGPKDPKPPAPGGKPIPMPKLPTMSNKDIRGKIKGKIPKLPKNAAGL